MNALIPFVLCLTAPPEAPSSGTLPLVPLPMFEFVVASGSKDEVESARIGLKDGIVATLEEFSSQVKGYTIKRLRPEVVMILSRHSRLGFPTAEELWGQAELRALSRELGLRYAFQLTIDRWSFSQAGTGGSDGTTVLSLEGRVWMSDQEMLAPPPREFQPIRILRKVGSREVADALINGYDYRSEMVKLGAGDFARSALTKVLEPNLR